jgi:hypothetical protein
VNGQAPAGIIDVELVTALVAEQFPQWRDLPIRQVLPGGVKDSRPSPRGAYFRIRLLQIPAQRRSVGARSLL